MLAIAALLSLAQPAQSAPQPAPAPPAGHLVSRSHLFGLPDGATGYVPASAGLHPPLLVLLQGAGHRQTEMVQHFQAEADKRGIVLLAPVARGVTWDVVLGAEEATSPDSPLAAKLAHRFSGSGDEKRVDAAIANLEKIVPIDPARTVLAGFSDGATFALAMGMSRDEHFPAVIAWSPGIAIRNVNPARGRRVFISHGRQDEILKFDVTCSEILPLLQQEGASVTFVAFNGGHEAPVWLKDTFLDAAFGPVPGSQAVRLPAQGGTCSAQAPSAPDIR